MYKNRLTIGLTLLLVVFIFGSTLVVGILKTRKPANAAGPSDWSTYLHDVARSGFNSTETAINAGSVGSLKQLWSYNEGTIISTQPAVANGKIYWGSWDGIEHATNLDGTQAWTANLGTVTSATCGGASLGIASSATVANVTINGTATPSSTTGVSTHQRRLSAITH